MKVRDVLAKIGDKPLKKALEERGWHVLDDDELEEATESILHEADVLLGYELYVTKNANGFRKWLRDLFWQELCRIA